MDQWDRNGSPELAAYGVAGFAHLPFRPMPPEDVRILKDKGVFVITTLAGEESHARTRLADLSFLREPLIADTAAPWVLKEITSEATRTLTKDETRPWKNGDPGSRRRRPTPRSFMTQEC